MVFDLLPGLSTWTLYFKTATKGEHVDFRYLFHAKHTSTQ